jgi:hypothetical protein
MTLVVGLHLGDTVGIVADTRVTVRDGTHLIYRDDALKIFQRPPLIIGLAGDAISAEALVTTFQLQHLVPLAEPELSGTMHVKLS